MTEKPAFLITAFCVYYSYQPGTGSISSSTPMFIIDHLPYIPNNTSHPNDGGSMFV